MEAMTLYGLPTSSSTGRVLTTAFEKDIKDMKLVHVDLDRGEHKRPEYLSMQPFGVIPVLKDGDFSIFESRAVARYLCLKYEHQGSPLYGRNLKERAHVEQWLEVESQNFHGPASALVYQLGSRPRKGLAPERDVVKLNLSKLEKVLDVYEDRLSDTDGFLVGDFFSLADLSHLPRASSLINGPAQQGHLFASRPHVEAWWKRISSRPSWVQLQDMAKNPPPSSSLIS